MLISALLAPLNHVLQANDWARARLQPHAGRHIRLSAHPFNLDCCITDSGHFAAVPPPAGHDGNNPAVTVSVPLSALPALALDPDRNPMTGVRLTGDAELADTLGFVLRNLNWEPEEDLSRLVGDMAAHRIVNAARSFPPLARRSAAAVSGNLREYLVDEAPVLVASTQLDDLSAQIRTLRDDIARFEKRLNRLKRN